MSRVGTGKLGGRNGKKNAVHGVHWGSESTMDLWTVSFQEGGRRRERVSVLGAWKHQQPGRYSSFYFCRSRQRHPVLRHLIEKDPEVRALAVDKARGGSRVNSVIRSSHLSLNNVKETGNLQGRIGKDNCVIRVP